MEVRRLTADDREQLMRVNSMGWENTYDRENPPGIMTGEKPWNEASGTTWGVFREGELCTGLVELHHILRFEGEWIQSSDICGVTTRPDFRRSGAIRAAFDVLFPWMYESGQIISCLHPFNVPFYRKFGYEGVYSVCDIETPVAALEAFSANMSRIEALNGKTGLPELDRFYCGFLADTNLAIRRNEALWSGRAGLDTLTARRYTYLYRGEDGEIAGYMTYEPRGEKGAKTMLVTELIYRDRGTLENLLGFVHSFASHYERVRFHELPMFLDFFVALQDFNRQCYSKTIDKMMRVIDVQKVLEKKRYPEREGAFSILVDDPLEWNCGIYDVQFGGGQSVVRKRASGDYDVAADACALSRLVVGEERPDSPAMALIRDLEIRGNRETILRAFPQRKLFHADFY